MRFPFPYDNGYGSEEIFIQVFIPHDASVYAKEGFMIRIYEEFLDFIF